MAFASNHRSAGYCRITAVRELAQVQQAHTRVLLSSIFFIADSVVSGNLTIANSSSFSAEGALQTRQPELDYRAVAA